MQILYFYQYFGTPKGKWSTRVYEMCRRWVEAGHQVKVVTSLYDKSDLTAKGLYTKHNIEGIQIYVVNIKLSNKHGFAFRIFTFLFYAIIASYLGLIIKADLIIASSGPITVGIPTLITKWIKRKPMIFEVRDLWPDGAVAFKIIVNPLLKKLSYWFEAFCYKNSALVIACSEGIKASILQRFPGTKISVIPNAADVELFRNRTYDESLTEKYKKDKIFVYTGTLGLIDDCIQIVEVAEELQNRNRKDIKILIIGDGKERMELENLSKEKELKNLEFLGLLPKDQLVPFVRMSKASILTVKPIPFMDHCSPNKMFDAFAAGIPILQTTEGWIKRLVAEHQCGINVLPRNPQHFADAIEKLADDEAFFKQLSQNSAHLGDTLFNRDLLTQKMLKDLKEVNAKH